MLETSLPAALDVLQAELARRPVLVLTGAGISTASGIPDYRDTEGVRRGNAPMMHKEFLGSAQARKRYWARAMLGWHGVSLARPNPAHEALARLQHSGHISGLVTQNVDGLHDAAGSTGVIELHGNLHWVVCMECGNRQPRQAVQADLEARNPYLQDIHAVLAPDGDAQLAAQFLEPFQVAQCPCCGSDLLKPDVVFFGDGVAQATARQAWQAVEQAGALLIVGTSLMAYSSFRLCQEISRQGKPLLAINLGRTRADTLLATKLEGPCEQWLPQLAEQLCA